MNKRVFLACMLYLLTLAVANAADVGWQVGRIVDVHKEANAKTTSWVANTPLTKDAGGYTITVQTKNKLIVAYYDVSGLQGPPPAEWVKDRPVRLLVEKNVLYLRPPAGSDYKLGVVKEKKASGMKPLTAQELAGIKGAPVAIGGAPGQAAGATSPEAPAPKSAAAPATPKVSEEARVAGTLSVTSVPELSEILVDGKSEGFTPGRIMVSPGKHTVVVQKAGYTAFSKGVTTATGQETTVNAVLVKGK
jgi:hypothetical protein